MNTTPGLALPCRLGTYSTGEDAWVDLAESISWAIQGQTRSGKSVSTYVLLSALAHRLDCLVAGLDPSGILLHAFDGHPRPDLRHLFAESWAAAADTLERIVAEHDRRVHFLVDHDLEKLDRPTVEIPYIYVVLEEYPGALDGAGDEDAAEGRKGPAQQRPRIQRYVSRLIREGQKTGVRVILIAQRMEASIVSGDTRSNIAGRITHRVDNNDSVKMLHPRAEAGAVDWVTGNSSPVIRPGLGLIQVPGFEGVRKFRADFMPYDRYLDVCRRGLEHQKEMVAANGLDWERVGHPDLFGPVNQYEEDWTDDQAAAS